MLTWLARVGRCLQFGLMVLGLGAVLVLASGLTNYPWRLYHWLSEVDQTDDVDPTLIVVLGGGGIPSGSGLMRTYAGAQVARAFPDVPIVVCLPADGDPETSSVGLMKKEMVMRGVEPSRISLEHDGRNTREQALLVAELFTQSVEQENVLVITSEAHTRRAFLTFCKLGFAHVSATIPDPQSAEADMRVGNDDVGGGQLQGLSDVVGENMTVRYQFWTRMAYLVKSGRELCALAYYRVKGWI